MPPLSRSEKRRLVSEMMLVLALALLGLLAYDVWRGATKAIFFEVLVLIIMGQMTSRRLYTYAYFLGLDLLALDIFINAAEKMDKLIAAGLLFISIIGVAATRFFGYRLKSRWIFKFEEETND